MSKFVVGDRLLRALYDAGVLDEDYTMVRRLVIDLEHGKVAKLYIERFADDEQLIAALTVGVEIAETEEAAGPTRGKTLP